MPVRVPAHQYISLVQRWIVGKIHDPKAFPTETPLSISSPSFESSYITGGVNTPDANKPIAMGPTSLNLSLSDLAGRNWVGKSMGFPETFLGDVKTAWRQMFRVYAHLYHSHFIEPFWHFSGSNWSTCNDLNSCFVHFISVAKLFGLLAEKDMEPMQPLIDIWIANGSIPPDAVNGTQVHLVQS